MSKDKKEDRNIFDKTERAAGPTEKKIRVEDTAGKEDKSPDRLEVLQAAGPTEKKIRVKDTTKKEEKSDSK